MFRPLPTALILIAAAMAAEAMAQPVRGPGEGVARAAMAQRALDAAQRADAPPGERPQMDMPRDARPPQSRQEVRSLSDAVRTVQRRTGGQILGAERVPYEGGVITRIKYMDDRGRVRYMDDPGATSERRSRPRRADNDDR